MNLLLKKLKVGSVLYDFNFGLVAAWAGSLLAGNREISSESLLSEIALLVKGQLPGANFEAFCWVGIHSHARNRKSLVLRLTYIYLSDTHH